jgi:putative transposase
MNPAKVTETDYIDFLIGTQRVYSCTEAERVHPEEEGGPSHDAYTRLLQRSPFSTEELWQEAKQAVDLKAGYLIVDDSTLDKWYSRKIELVTRHWSGKHHRVVSGINLITLLWTDGDRSIPVDYCIYDKANDGLSKNDHMQAMLSQAQERGFEPEYVLFDRWYASLPNLKRIRSFGWRWFTRLKENRQVNPDNKGNRPLHSVDLSEYGTVVHLKGYGFIKVFRIVATNGDVEYWATSDLEMNELARLKYTELSWMIETYHRGIKQVVGIERCQARSARAQRNHIGFALRAFLRLEYHCFVKGISWYEAKIAIIRDAVRAYLAHPTYTFNSQLCATA